MKTLQKIKVFFYKNFLSLNKPVYGKKVKIKHPTIFLGKGKIILKDKTHIGYFPSPYYYDTYSHIEARHNTAIIDIAEKTMINNNCCIIANETSIIIGNNCRIGVNFKCYDSDFHGLKIQDRDDIKSIINKSVKIGNEVFIGNDVTILKGVTLGDGCVVGAGSVVTKSFGDNSMIAGNPAKLIKMIQE